MCLFTAVCVHLDGLNAEHKFTNSSMGHHNWPHVTSLIVNRQENALIGWIHADKLCESVVSLNRENECSLF